LSRKNQGRHPACIAALGFALLAMGLLVPSRVVAHSELVSSDPAANSSLPRPPDALRLVFSEPIDPPSASVQLLDTQQTVLPGVGPLRVDAAGTTATVPVPDLEAGTYTVSYQVTSAVDGHVTSGIFAFLVDPTGTQPPPVAESSSTSLSSGPDVIAARWLAIAGTLALAGIVIFWLFSARPALTATGIAEVPAPWGPIALTAAAALVGVVLYLTLAARPIIESGGHLSHGDTFPLDFAAPFGWTPFANAMRVAMVGSFATFGLAVAHWVAHDEARRRDRPAPLSADLGWLLVVLVACVVTLGGMSFAGHAAALGGPLLALVDLVHLLGVSAWIGTLVGLFLLVLRAREAVVGALRRHSRLALVAAPVVVLSGLANSPLVLGSSRELVASGYGNLIVAKAMLFSIAVGIGSANFFLVRSGISRRSLPLIGAELLLGALAVLAAAGLVSGQPSANRQPVLVPPALSTLHLYGQAGDSSVHVAVNLPAPGSQLYQVGVSELATGAPLRDVQRVILVFTPPDGSGLAPERVELESDDDPSLWSTRGAYTPVVGDWQFEAILRRIGELDESTTFMVTVSEPQPPETVPPPDIGVGAPPVLAAVWAFLPDGSAGWLLVVALLGAAVAAGIVARARPSASTSAARAAVVLVAVVIGVAIGSRALVQAANEPPAAAAATNPIPATADSVTRGHHLYLANCAACHGILGDGDGPTAQRSGLAMEPLFDRVPVLDDGTIAYRIAVGTVGSQMPGFASTLSQADRWDLVNYLRAAFGASP
jgi:copper transport protein